MDFKKKSTEEMAKAHIKNAISICEKEGFLKAITAKDAYTLFETSSAITPITLLLSEAKTLNKEGEIDFELTLELCKFLYNLNAKVHRLRTSSTKNHKKFWEKNIAQSFYQLDAPPFRTRMLLSIKYTAVFRAIDKIIIDGHIKKNEGLHASPCDFQDIAKQVKLRAEYAVLSENNLGFGMFFQLLGDIKCDELMLELMSNNLNQLSSIFSKEVLDGFLINATGTFSARQYKKYSEGFCMLQKEALRKASENINNLEDTTQYHAPRP